MAQFSVKIIRLNGAVLDENQHLMGPFFFFSKGFSEAIRLSETGFPAEIGL